jgi:hypothetical protein
VTGTIKEAPLNSVFSIPFDGELDFVCFFCWVFEGFGCDLFLVFDLLGKETGFDLEVVFGFGFDTGDDEWAEELEFDFIFPFIFDF